MNKFKKFTDDEGSLYVSIEQIAYFYYDEESSATVICLNNGISLYVNETIEYVLELVKWL